MKKFLGIISVFLILLLVGCATGKGEQNKEEMADVGRTEENAIMVDFVLDNPVWTFSSTSNAFNVFGKNGYFVRYYGTKIIFDTSSNVLALRGTWKFEDNTLKMTVIERVDMVPDEDKQGFHLKYDKRGYQDDINNLKFISIGEKGYLSGSQSLYSVSSVIHDNLYNEVKKYVTDGIENLDYELLKQLDEENTSLNKKK